MKRPARSFAIIFAILSTVFGIFLFVFGILIISSQPNAVNAIKETYKGFFINGDPSSADSIVLTIGITYISLGILYLIGALLDSVILKRIKGKTILWLNVLIASFAIIFAQLVPGVLVIIYSVAETKKKKRESQSEEKPA